LFGLIRDGLVDFQVHYSRDPEMRAFRAGDVKHSLAAIDKAERLLGYRPTHRIGEGLTEALPWYIDFHRRFGGGASV
jgi:UDP-N-acetylglucosamine 4-epimerase